MRRNNLENEIKDFVQNAINTMDFNQLNKNIENTVGNALNEVRRALNKDSNYQGQNPHIDPYIHIPRPNESRQSDYSYHEDISRRSRRSREAYTQSKDRTDLRPYPSVPVGHVSGILCTVFGWILLPSTSIAILVLTLIGILNSQLSLFGTIAAGIFPVSLISLLLIISGSRSRGRLRRFNRYISIFNDKTYYSIKDLSALTQWKPRYILKDLRKMITLGMFPEGHIDDQETCIILNQESYHQYQQLQKNMQMQQTTSASPNNQATDTSETSDKQQKEKSQTSPELQAAIAHGRSCIIQIRQANDDIPGVEYQIS